MYSLKEAIIFIATIIFLFTGCSDKKTVEEIKSIKLGDKTIIAGNQFRLTPLKNEPITLSGKDISLNDFMFKCTLLVKETEILYKGAVTFQASYSTGVTTTETQSRQEVEKWPTGITEKDISISLTLLPTVGTYSGEGFLYFYLINKENQCISNIIKIRVKFV